ncbi:MAG: VWA domain-containing protein [Acidimicrobiaceae bacterium]|nr:VWA domain-containing protein [Acidimicrobiaceae bacterium]
MIKRVVEFAEALRRSKVPVSLLESIDACSSLASCDIADRSALRSYLSATLIKDHSHQKVFDQLFELYFSPGTYQHGNGELLSSEGGDEADGVFDDFGDIELRELIKESLLQGDEVQLHNLLASAVSRYAGIEPGRPVGGVYYAFKTLRQLDMEKLKLSLFDARFEEMDKSDSLGIKMMNRDIELALDKVRKLVDDDIRRRIVGDRGAEAVARTLRATLPEDIDFMHANADELREISRALAALARKLAARLGQRRRRGHRGSLDFRRTIRRSIANGGVPVDLFFHKPVPTKPELVIVADISGSVASFARFTLSMVYALSEQFSKVRSFVFIDEIDEVTEIFESSDDIEQAIKLVSTKARVVWLDGHSDYGRVMESFVERWGEEITHRSTVIFLGDARNNYHPSRSQVLASVRMKARAVYWLNPEPSAYWDSGDSIMSQYSVYCDSVDECRNLRQLQSFVEKLV